MIDNFKIPVTAEQLSDSELIVTLTLLLRGNYSEAAAYFTVCKSAQPIRALNTIINACADAGVQFNNSSGRNSYTNCNNVRIKVKSVKLILAKQALLPDRKWKNELRIPASWFELTPTRLHILFDFFMDLVKFNHNEYILPDDLEFSLDLVKLFKPIIPSIRTEYSKKINSQTIIIDEDDISDLL